MAAADRTAEHASRCTGTATSAWSRRRSTRSPISSATGGPSVPRLEDLPRVHEAVGIERALDRAHHLQLERALVAPDLVALQRAQAVLRADGAVQRLDDVVDDAVHLRRFGEERLGRLPLGLAAVV